MTADTWPSKLYAFGHGQAVCNALGQPQMMGSRLHGYESAYSKASVGHNNLKEEELCISVAGTG